MLVLGGSLHHPGGLESFCERTTTAINRHAQGWRATWWPTDTAYLTARGIPPLARAWRRLRDVDKHAFDLVWVQWSTFSDLLFLRRIVALGLPVMVTPHLGANARLQRVPALRALCARLLAQADRLALLFDGQDTEIVLPRAVPRSILGTFLPEESLAPPRAEETGGPLRLLHAGRLSRAKGTFRMVAICAFLRDRGVAFEAAIVGRGEPKMMEALSEEISQAGLTDSLRLAGWMDGPALRAALHRADILVHLSELDSFPLIVMEALAADALPLVADMAGAASMVRRYDGLVTQGSDVAAAAEWLVAHTPAELRRRGAAAGERVRDDHRWPAIVRKLEDIADRTAATDGPKL
jgi:glycosyltransferase involved in cell wall biosynthesis